jgi:three-Cys-motif partner protein
MHVQTTLKGGDMSHHIFGGDWTTEKLERVRKYLRAYTTIFASNERARRLTTTYVDAFAGSGSRLASKTHGSSVLGFDELIEPDNQAFLKGSARIALEVEPAFRQYLFIEKAPERVQELERLKHDFPNKASRITIEQADANSYLARWCDSVDWRHNRAVVFLDPYGMQVDWNVIQAIGQTRAIDMWMLFPLGMGVNRLLTRREPPPTEWAGALTRIFGTDSWQDAFYPTRTVRTLFGEEEHRDKQADFEAIGRFFVERLKTVFAAVAESPLLLRNSKNSPLYMLCFAAENPTASKIARDVLRR